MTSQDKLIKQGIKYTDKLFDEISKRIEKGVRQADTLEEFLVDYHKAFPEKGNPLVSLGYDKEMLDIILSETNNHKFSRPAQKELVRVTIENQVGDLLVDVGDDVKESVRSIVSDGYDNNLSQDEIAENISTKVTGIKNRRARAIARTEIARTATVSDYVINRERGATGWYVECRNTACPVCKDRWHKSWTPETDDSFTPSDTSAGGKGWIGDRIFSMNDTSMLPPVHPNCRCVVYYTTEEPNVKIEPVPVTTTTNSPREPTKEELSQNLTPSERAKYANYRRVIDNHTKWLNDNPSAPSEQITNHKAKLDKAQKAYDELRNKALGGNGADTPEIAPKPKPEPTPKEEPKPKATPKPQTKSETKPKTKTEEVPKIPNPTNKQLKNNLTSVELKRYKRYQKEIKEGKLSPDFIEQRKKDLDALKRKALGLNSKDSVTSEKGQTQNKPKPKLEAPFDEKKRLTKDQLDKMDFKELAEHHGAEYKGVEVYDYDGKKYHVIEQTFSDGRKFTLRFEEGAVKSYTKQGIATPNEIIHEVFKVPEAMRIETKEIWFKNTQQGIRHRINKTGYDTLTRFVGGYNTCKIFGDKNGDAEHRIVINPKNFKGGGKDSSTWIKHPNDARNWKMTIFHEFVHSGDLSKEIWQNSNLKEHSIRKEYRDIEKEEKGFTWYANKKIEESFAEHGGYIAYMEANPSEQSKRIEVKHLEDGILVTRDINYEQYKKMYPKHYEYFMKKFEEGF